MAWNWELSVDVAAATSEGMNVGEPLCRGERG